MVRQFSFTEHHYKELWTFSKPEVWKIVQNLSGTSFWGFLSHNITNNYSGCSPNATRLLGITRSQGRWKMFLILVGCKYCRLSTHHAVIMNLNFDTLAPCVMTQHIFLHLEKLYNLIFITASENFIKLLKFMKVTTHPHRKFG